MHGIAFDNTSGVLYGAGANELYRISTATGQAQLIGTIGSFGSQIVGSLAFEPVSHVLYGSTVAGPASLLTIDTTTGQGTVIASTIELAGLAFHPLSGVLYGVDNGSSGPPSLYTVDRATGLTTLVGQTGLGNNLDIAFVVPEPSALSLLGLAALASILRGWRIGRRSGT